MEEITFEYKPLPTHKSKLFPLAKVDLLYRNNKQSFWPIIDSGANVSLFPKAVGDALGIDFEGDPEPVEGVLGIFLGYSHYVNITLGDYKEPISIRALFLMGEPYPLLGREGVFEKFDVLFQERLRKVVFMRR